MVKRLYNPETFDTEIQVNAPQSPLDVRVYVCVHTPIDVHVVGGVVVCAVLSSGGTYRLCQCNSVGDIAAVCTASSHFFLGNVLSSLVASLHIGSLHPVVLIITADFFPSGCT
ncbi:Hypothetical predicted protein [Xyrichtys novacula]|uniref:Uncharacterized protein n=1 Tax=Xyrichtys novacula TaxID=13765 RepID=A0AAV1G1K1_XYRNO|nr:Hypothetical predicted protein [Xyrichtys novacula]